MIAGLPSPVDAVRALRRWAVSRQTPHTDGLLLPGEAVITVTDAETGAVLDRQVVNNRPKDGYMKTLINELDPNSSQSAIEASHFAVGTDGSESVSGFLGSEQFRDPVAASNDKGSTIEVTAELAKGDANGLSNDLKEAGLTNTDDSTTDTPINRITIEPITKTDEIEVKFRFKTSFIPEEEL